MKTLVMVGGVTIVGVLILAVSMFLIPSVGVTKSNFDGIPLKATKGDVHRILGDPAFARWPRKKIFIFPPMPDLAPGCVEIRWKGYEGVAIFHIDENTHVLQRGWYPSGETLRDKIDRWLGY